MPAQKSVERFRALAGQVAQRSLQLQAMRKLVEPLRTGGLEPVEGESSLLSDLEAKLHSAMALLSAPSNGAALNTLSDQIDELINDVSWEIEEDLRPDLQQKLKKQEEALKNIQLDLQAWDGEVTELAKKIEAARSDGAPFSALEGELDRARRLVASIRSAMTERLYRGLPELKTSAAAAVAQLGANLGKTMPQVDRVRKLVKQADLLIMQVGVVEGYYEYKVLLRSADRLQTRGINIIQDTRQVSPADRDYMLALLAELTKTINHGIRSAHAAAHPPPAGALRTISPADESGDLPARSSTEALRILGEIMYKLVIPAEVQAYLKRELWSFSITTNELELPWELISFEGEGGEPRYLCLERCISRMPLAGLFPVSPPRRATGPPTKRRMLLIHSDPKGDLPAAAREADAVAQALGDRVDIERVDPDQATNSHLNDILMEKAFDFIHYAGHAYFDLKKPDLSGLQLKDSLLTAEKIRFLNRGGSLVFLNACESGTVARDETAQRVSYLLNKPQQVVGLASAFVYSGALGCVGSLWPVYDRPAAELAVKFYEHVLEGEPTGEALRRARNEIRAAYPREVTWAGYVLYGDPTYRLTES